MVMARGVTVRRNWRQWWQLIAAGSGFCIIIAWLLFGSTGLFAWNDYSRALAHRQAELARLEQQQKLLENHLRLLNPRHVDPDLVEERVRRDLNLMHPDDIVVPLPKR